MGNRIFERRSTPEVFPSVFEAPSPEEEQERRRVVGLLAMVTDFWLYLFKTSITPLRNSVQGSVLRIDAYACSVFDFIKHNSITKKLQASSIITSTQHFFTSKKIFTFSTITDAVLYFPSSIIVPYNSINNSIWLHENDQMFMEYIGYVPIHPSDLINLLERPSRLCYNMMYASR